MAEPAIAVVIPCFNAAAHLAQAVASVLAQSRPPAEILLVDDGSTDGTAALARSLAAGSPVPIRCLQQANAGPSAARNRGAAAAQAPCLLFLDADDRLLPDALARLAGAWAREPGLDLVYGGRIDIHPDGRRRAVRPPPLTGRPSRDFLDYLRRRRPVIGPGCALVHRRVFDTIRYPEAIRVAEDFVFYALVLARHRCASIADPVVEHVVDEQRGQTRVLRRWRDVEQSVGLVFDPALLPAPLLRHRREYEARVALTLFRAFHRAGQDRTARAFYHRALAKAPARALRLGYLRKYLRGVAGLEHPLLRRS